MAVEVVSYGDSRREVREKVEECLRAGVRMVRAIFPIARTPSVYRSIEDVASLTEDDNLEGVTVVSGITCCVGDLFD